MCEVLDRAENKGKIKGKIEGKIEAYLDMGLSVEEIAQKLNISTDEVSNIITRMKDNGDAILQLYGDNK